MPSRPANSFLRSVGAALALAIAGFSPQSHAADPTTMRIAGNFSSNTKHVDEIEKPFFIALPKLMGAPITINYNPMDVVNVQAADALRLLRSGTFDVMSVQIGMASRDDPFFEGVDLIGVSTNMKDLRKAVDAYREVFDQRLQKRFNAKVLTLWPFGPQVFYCNKPIKTIDDVKGMKIRSFTPSMAELIKTLGATPVTLQFSEVYPALQRGVADCGVTSPTSGNSGKWPEVTTHFLPLSVSGSVQGHFMNLDYWNKFSPDAQKKLLAGFKQMEDRMWDLADTSNDDAMNCNVGAEPCTKGTKFKMTMVPVTPADAAKVKAAVTSSVLPLWKASCNKVDPKCTEVWNATVGKARGFDIK
ncbi:ABC transporter substrate-binding protein [Rhodoferax koreense]|uniref:ABC transporter substrate-binding protein n=1 Tax=Rhodoferax koreensis TaxID=1842727 RepID=A0A1P8K045_9BURK|nr:TRAP transporter substrate-binding protein [Rhodoferax koreense]APW39367.1 ABC transporter substrate-binding protein [Rhodoferax koreense]